MYADSEKWDSVFITIGKFFNVVFYAHIDYLCLFCQLRYYDHIMKAIAKL